MPRKQRDPVRDQDMFDPFDDAPPPRHATPPSSPPRSFTALSEASTGEEGSFVPDNSLVFSGAHFFGALFAKNQTARIDMPAPVGVKIARATDPQGKATDAQGVRKDLSIANRILRGKDEDLAAGGGDPLEKAKDLPSTMPSAARVDSPRPSRSGRRLLAMHGILYSA